MLGDVLPAWLARADRRVRARTEDGVLHVFSPWGMLEATVHGEIVTA